MSALRTCLFLTLAALGQSLVPRALLAQQEVRSDDGPFPASNALAEEVSPDALQALSDLVQGFVDDEEIVGAEMLVIKNGHSILHEAYGLREIESEQPMEVGGVFCVRSMTKPLIGASVLMLIDDKQLGYDDRASKYLPSFDVDGLREITIEQLLTHTSGLPMSQIMSADLLALQEQGGIRAVADMVDAGTLEFEPGAEFNYSDQGTDTLTAIVEIVSGKTPEEFVTERLLSPLGMEESTCLMTEGHPLRAKGCAKYIGSEGNWTKFWDTSQRPIFPFFLGSQSLYASLTDYARFLQFWTKKGRVGKERLLGSRFVRKALTPGPYPLGGPTGFPDLQTDYGCLMQLWTGEAEGDEGGREVVAFGHTGSDGTHGWVFPEQDAMVLYFTQTRGTNTGLRVEEALGALFLGASFDPNQLAPPFDDYLGYYRENEEDLYRAVIRDGDDLALDISARAVVPLTFIGEDRWKMRPNPSVVLAFDRNDAGEITGYHIDDHVEYRFEPHKDLPTVDELVERMMEVHNVGAMEQLGTLRMEYELSIPKMQVTGEVVGLTAWPNRFRIDTLAQGRMENYSFDGEDYWYVSTDEALGHPEEARLQDIRDDNIFARFGDWRLRYPNLEVVQHIKTGDDKEVYLIRSAGTEEPGSTFCIEAKTGRLVGMDKITNMPGMGAMGTRTLYTDFREVEGMLLPFKTETRLNNSMVGSIDLVVTDYQVGVELPEGSFTLVE